MVVRSAGNMAGYWNDREATDRAIKMVSSTTGDPVRQDSDGYPWFRGHKEEVIVRGGSNISPQEVEAVLYQNAGVRKPGSSAFRTPSGASSGRLRQSTALVWNQRGRTHRFHAQALGPLYDARGGRVPRQAAEGESGKALRRTLFNINLTTTSPEFTVTRQ